MIEEIPASEDQQEYLEKRYPEKAYSLWDIVTPEKTIRGFRNRDAAEMYAIGHFMEREFWEKEALPNGTFLRDKAEIALDWLRRQSGQENGVRIVEREVTYRNHPAESRMPVGISTLTTGSSKIKVK